jgi:two-component system CheB/CheR fusion protein
VAIGAANGGACTFVELLQHIPVNTDMAYIYIQHLDNGDSDGSLVDSFQRTTKLIVKEAKEASPVHPNHVYVIPPTMTRRQSGHHLSARVNTPSQLFLNPSLLNALLTCAA